MIVAGDYDGLQLSHALQLFAARGGYIDAAKLLVGGGADVNQLSAGDKTSPLLIATINGQFDLAEWLLDRGANPNAASANGVTPLYAALNVTWAPRALYPQPRAFQQQGTAGSNRGEGIPQIMADDPDELFAKPRAATKLLLTVEEQRGLLGRVVVQPDHGQIGTEL